MARPVGPGSREPSPSVSSASGFDPSREKAEAEARKREAHKRPGLANGKRWQAVHTPERGWHVALVDNHAIVEFAARMKAREALHSGDLRAFMDAASEALMARVSLSLSDSNGSGEAGETPLGGSTEGDSAGRNGIAQPAHPKAHTSIREIDGADHGHGGTR
jgi:hypothetical protein